MDRRHLLALAVTLPALASTRASACSVALKSARSAGLENEQIRDLFGAWFGRDEARFRELFTRRLMADGSPMDSQLATELSKQDPLPAATFDIFGRFFTDQAASPRVTLILNTASGIIVGCAEGSALEIGADCSGMPKLHLFLIAMLGLNPRSITHLATTNTVETGKFSIWTE